MIATHSVSAEVLAALATGYGGPDAVREIWRGQESRRLLLLKALVEAARPDAETDAAVAAIVAAEERSSAARGLLTEPMVGVWAGTAIRDPAQSPAVARHLGAVAAAACLVAGADAELYGYPRDGWLYLPAVGRLRVAADQRRVRLSTSGGRLWLDGVEVAPGGPHWQLRRRMTVDSGQRLAVYLEDLDPYRDAYHVPAAGRLADSDYAEWHRRLAGSWSILTEFLPGRAAEIAAGLHSLVPLTPPTINAAHSATAREAVGVVGLDLPSSPADFAVALVHEFQHSKLSALLDIVPLYDSSTRQTFFAPWRADPRPIGGFFQGVYAFLGVADVWRALSTRPDEFPSAQQEFAEARAQVSDAVGTLATSGLLTAPGRRFVTGLTEAVERLHLGDIPPAKVAAAQRVLETRRANWRQGRR